MNTSDAVGLHHTRVLPRSRLETFRGSGRLRKKIFFLKKPLTSLDPL